MNSTPSSSPDLESRAALREQDEQRLRLAFLRLTDVGIEMVHLVAERAREEALAPAATPAKLPELVISYDRLMRSLRRTALLILKFTAPEPVHTPAAPRPDSARKPPAADLPDTETAQMSDAEPAERLDRLERLEDEDEGYEDDEFAGMSHEEIARAYRSSRAAAAQPGVDNTARPMAAETGAQPRPAVPAAPLHAGFAPRQPEDAAGRGVPRWNGAAGCRDP
jgi:hypothetical protein